jgi:hypothetical protein
MSLSYWDGLVQGQPTEPKKVIVHSHIPLRELVAKDESGKFQANVHQKKDSVDAWEMDVAPDLQKLAPGRFSCQLRIVGTSSEALQRLTKTLKVEGLVNTDIRALPSKIDFGIREQGQSVEETVTISSTTNQPFEIQGIDLPDDDSIKVTPAANQSKVYRVVQSIKQHGYHAADVTFKIALPKGPVVVVPIEVCYHGVSQ